MSKWVSEDNFRSIWAKIKDLISNNTLLKNSTATQEVTGRIDSKAKIEADNQLVTKKYVDDKVAAVESNGNIDTTQIENWVNNNYLAKKGGAVTGAITTNRTTFNNNELITKDYVNTNYIPQTGGNVTGAITTNKTTFSNNKEFVSKQYVDTQKTNLENQISEISTDVTNVKSQSSLFSRDILNLKSDVDTLTKTDSSLSLRITSNEQNISSIKNDLFSQWLNRTNHVNQANTNYTTYMARGVALLPANSSSTPTVNGTIAWYYGEE